MALGSPDPYGRQLDGLGGGISSLSKACIIGPPTHPDADVDYTFAQVEVKSPVVDYSGNCGNCSSAVGPFAIDEGLVKATDGETLVRIHNTNTRKIIVSHVPVKDGEAAVEGDFELAGVAGRGARITLDFTTRAAPGRAGSCPPAGRASGSAASRRRWWTPPTRWSSSARSDLGLVGTESPQAIDADRGLAARLEAIRVEAAARMGISGSAAVPKIAMVAAPVGFTALDGTCYESDRVDVVARVISMGACHRAFALTAAMCLAVAARVDGTLVREYAGNVAGDIRLGHPSGVLPIDAAVRLQGGGPWAERVTVYRTARRIMEGFARIP